MNVDEVVKSLVSDLKNIKDISEFESLSLIYTGRNGYINKIFSEVKNFPLNEKKIFGAKVNKVKKEVEMILSEKRKELLANDGDFSSIDVSLPAKKLKVGRLHQHTIIRRQMNKIFAHMGFSIYEGPHIETDEYVFERANLPKDHPARSLQDTILIEDPDIILRSHTSSVENRALEKEELPLRIVAPGVAFRYETPNQTNHFLFFQYQGVAVAKDITMANLKGSFSIFFKLFFGEDTETRFRAKYYPEVEPGAGIDISCTFCKGDGCSACKYRGWVEVGGSGMIHPNMLRSAGIDSKEYTGFAFGLGFDRLVMQKTGIDDIRKLYNGSLLS